MEDIIESNEVFEIDVVKKHQKKVYDINDFTQSQAHGLFWDNEIREKVFELPSCKNDTTKYDICCSDNKYDSNENVSIKTTKSSNIDCGDILRFYNGDFTNKYTIILIKYSQNGNKKIIDEIVEIDYNEELRNYLFGSITEEILTNYVKSIKSIPKGPVSVDIKNTYKLLKNQLQSMYNMNINISPKVDSKSQRRVQCSITRFDNLLKKFPQNIITRTTTAVIRGVLITSSINSEPRKRNIKPNLDK